MSGAGVQLPHAWYPPTRRKRLTLVTARLGHNGVNILFCFLLFYEENILFSIVYLLSEMMMEAFVLPTIITKIKLVQFMRKTRPKIIQLGRMCHISLDNSDRTRNMTNATFYGRKLGGKTFISTAP